MNLYILRHGIADEIGPNNHFKDAERALTREGRSKLSKVAKAMVRLQISLDLILSSPYERARQTADLIAEGMRCPKAVELTETLAPSGSTKKLIGLLRHLEPAANNLLLVGHEPYLSGLASLLAFGETSSSLVLKKGGLCRLSTLALRHGRCASIEWLLTPKQLQLIA